MTLRKPAVALIVLLAVSQLGACSAAEGTAFGRMRPWGDPAIGFSATAAQVPADWNRALGIFEVRGYPCIFLRSATLYRRTRGRWEQAGGLAGPWIDIASTGLPPGFRWPEAEAACDTVAERIDEAPSYR